MIVFVLARADNGVIGVDGRLPWHLPADLKRFRALTTGKPMGNGLPIAAVVSRSEIFAAYEPAYFNTFAGTPVTVAAARRRVRADGADGGRGGQQLRGEHAAAQRDRARIA